MSRNYQKFTEMSRNSQKGLRITRNSQKCQKCPKFWDMPVWERWCCVNSVTVLRQLCHCFQDFTKFLINLLNLLNFYWISDKFTEFAEFRCVWLYLLCPAVSDCPVPAVSGYVRLSRTRMCRTIPVRGCVGGCGGRCRCRWLWGRCWWLWWWHTDPDGGHGTTVPPRRAPPITRVPIHHCTTGLHCCTGPALHVSQWCQ